MDSLLRNPTASQPLILASLFSAVILIAIFVLISTRKSQSKRNVLLLTGPLDSGKTSIFSSLIYNQTLPTITSMQVNSSFRKGKRDPIQVVDIPGHPRLRDQFKEYLPSAKAIAFVVDANTVSRNAAVVAEHLHTILSALASVPPSQPLPTLLILAHKSDLLIKSKATSSGDPTSLAITRVQTILERELERRRLSSLGGMGVEALGDESSSGGSGIGMSGLECTTPGGVFKFENWEGGEVALLGTSTTTLGLDEKAGTTNTGMDSLREWIEENM